MLHTFTHILSVLNAISLHCILMLQLQATVCGRCRRQISPVDNLELFYFLAL